MLSNKMTQLCKLSKNIITDVAQCLRIFATQAMPPHINIKCRILLILALNYELLSIYNPQAIKHDFY